MKPVVQWQAPSPLWTAAGQDQASSRRLRQPTLLRFAGDDFMEQLAGSLQRLAEEKTAVLPYVARPETWREAASGWLAENQFDPNRPVKLYHPAHQRFYLLTASLVCRIPGLPDKVVDTADEEKVSFVLRRLQPREGVTAVIPSNPATFYEYGWLPGLGWARVPAPTALADTATHQEERLPMFPLSYGENGHRRRLLAGFLPVGSRESYQAAPELNPLNVEPPENDPLADYRVAQWETAVVGGFTSLAEALSSNPIPLSAAQAQEVLLFAMLDFAEFIHDYLPANWDNNLSGRVFFGSVTWQAALQTVWQNRQDILDGVKADVSFIHSTMGNSNVRGRIGTAVANLNILSLRNTALNALPPDPPDLVEQFQGAAPDLTAVPKLDNDAIYVARCVYEKVRCPIRPPIVSQEPSAPFQFAPFFDPDAPARPIRIAMPIDTSIKGLRQFPKSVSFLISNELRKQMERIEGVKLSALDDGDIPEGGGFDLGMICSLSIPIITIAALILLMIIVFLLNIVFFWLPFLKICLPLNLKVK